MDGFNDFDNPQVAKLPLHLKQYIVQQHYERYTPIDHAVWRYVMRQNYAWLKDVAHYPYIPGLKKAGLSIEHIPNMQDVNDALGKIGWGAVTVDGFIPPAAFMEYQAYRVLVIAADIRQLNHIAYTPAPDIIHESAGHAPIIAEPDYHKYLSYFGSIGAKAMFSAQDYDLYEAIRALSILKEMPDCDPEELQAAEDLLKYRQENMGEPSEMALLSRLHWWTVEYGLIGTLENPKIYGAGLLSSIGESAGCMKPEVAKLPYTIDAVNYSYDITKPQPQLFVTPDFENLIDVLETFANTMSFRRGGSYGLQKAIDSKNTCTAVYSSGLQVSGTFAAFIEDKGLPVFIRTTGPSALAYNNRQLHRHGKDYHKNGFSSPVGKLSGAVKPLEDFGDEDLQLYGITIYSAAKLQFESGVIVQGHVRSLIRNAGKLQLISFSDCTVTDAKGNVLFDPSWGMYDMAVGERIISVYCGAADKDAFEEIAYTPATTTYHPDYDQQTVDLQKLYGRVREIREHKGSVEHLGSIWQRLIVHHPNDWLCALEILEILKEQDQQHSLEGTIVEFLTSKAAEQPGLQKLITDGLNLVKNVTAKPVA
ncbi:aromatic amino acid hydroxylase [Mucilaginibacter ginkgonis]|uniref:Aromatic amino acid hydroxylase n=1 Tax=Mucilaginibacter ginkgonis TaxID=2682091 RepID=A0A6I4I077_9SPHI|nr:aromatic amino acid hydroxylase [Mucilaginibacter ginkgonis]QQL49857.1 aromatic amino acid hydroxylase [Mucilaginibacter ginkgonis]